MIPHFDLGIIGGGAIGLATAYKFQLKYPHKTLVLFEKEQQLAAHQTGRNSGVIHSGIYYKPNSLKAINCLEGRHQLVSFAQKNKVNHDVCGKIILATSDDEVPLLQKIYDRGITNKTEDIRLINPPEIHDIEPHTQGVKAIWVPGTGIINYSQLCERLSEKILEINPQSKILYNTEVKTTFNENNTIGIHTNNGNFGVSQKVFCAGLQADRMAKMDGVSIDIKIVGFRGDYYELTPQALHKVKNLIYPVPDPAFPFLGVHFTRMTDGSIECGPNAVFTFKREGYNRTDFNFDDTLDALSYAGTWKLFAKHYKKGMNEYARAFSKKLFLKALQKMIPNLKTDDIKPARSGVRAQAIDSDGKLIDDFKFAYGHKSVHVLNAPSPAATACLAIADKILIEIEKQNMN